jgi:hypothetical protein
MRGQTTTRHVSKRLQSQQLSEMAVHPHQRSTYPADRFQIDLDFALRDVRVAARHARKDMPAALQLPFEKGR